MYSTIEDVRGILDPSLSPEVVTDTGQPGGQAPSIIRVNSRAPFSTDQDWLINDCIVEADGIIDENLCARYATPVAPGPDGHPLPALRSISRNIAAYLVTLRLRNSTDLADADPMVRRYKDTMARLKALNTGQSVLPIPGNDTGSSGSGRAGRPINPSSRPNLFDGLADVRPVHRDRYDVRRRGGW